MITYDLSTYGVVYGSGQSEATQRANRAAVAAAIAAANAGSVTDNVECVGLSTFDLEVYIDPATDQVARDVGGTIASLGAMRPASGRTFTFRNVRLVQFPDAPAFEYNTLYLDGYSAQRSFALTDMSIAGPPSFGGSDPLLDPNRYLVYHQGSTTPGLYARASLNLTRCTLNGQPLGAFSTSSGDVDVRVTDTTLRGIMVAGSVFNPGLCNKSLLIEGGNHASLYTATDEGVCWYIHPNISPGGAIEADGQVMVTSGTSRPAMACPTRYCLYYNGTAGVSTPAPTSRIIVENVDFTGGDFIQTNYVCSTEVRFCNGTVDAAESFIWSRAALYAHDCVVSGGVIIAADGPLGVGAHTFQRVERMMYTSLFTATTNNFCSFANGSVDDCDVAGAATSFAVFGTATPILGDSITLTDVRASGTIGRGFLAAGPTSYSATIPLTITLLRCEMLGTSPFLRVIGSGGTDLVDINVVDCVTDDNALQALGMTPNTIRGSGNVLRAGFPWDPTWGGTPSQQRIVNKVGTNPTPVASAASINLHPSYNRVAVTGVTTIDTMLIAGDADQNNGFLGRYYLVLGGTLTIGNLGNITRLNGTPRAAGSVLGFQWDQGTLRWVEFTPTNTTNGLRIGFNAKAMNRDVKSRKAMGGIRSTHSQKSLGGPSRFRN